MEISAQALMRIAGYGFGYALWGAPNGESQFRPDTWMVHCGVPISDLNYAWIGNGPLAEERLRAVHAAMATRELPAIYFSMPELFEQLDPVATELGLTHVGGAPFMICKPDGAPRRQNTFDCDRIENDAQMQEIYPLLAAAFSIPIDAFRTACGPAMFDSRAVDVFVASRDGQPISTATTTSHGPIVGIWSMATPPEFQGQGAGRAAIECAMAWHQERGVELFYLGATVAGKKLYEKVGFTTVVDVPVWVSGVSTQMPV